MKSVLERNLGFLGYPNYSVDTEGNVWTLNYRHTGKVKVLKGTPHNKGYLKVLLYRDGKGKIYFVHQLVALAFIPNPNNYLQVNHKDETKKMDNSVENLEWCDAKYNVNYGTRTERMAETNSKPILQINKYTNEVIKVWKSAAEVEREKGYFQGNISACCNHKRGRKTVGGYKWEYT